MGLKLGYKEKDLIITEESSKSIVRLPLFVELGENAEMLNYVINSMNFVLESFY